MTQEQKLSNRFKKYLKRPKRKYGEFFDYSSAVYVDLETPILIICPKHGGFYKTPREHVKLKNGGCSECAKENKKEPVIVNKSGYSKDDFIIKAKAKFGDRFIYDLSEFKFFYYPSIKIICPVHGEIKMRPCQHLVSENGCQQCGIDLTASKKRFSYDEMVNRVKLVHGDKYLVEESNREHYKNTSQNIKAVCKIHGTFWLRASRLIDGKGCQRCATEKNNSPGVYSFKLFDSIPELSYKPAILYYLKINNGEYYKIGITTNSINRRISYFKTGSIGVSDVEVIKFRKMPLLDAFKTEQFILHYIQQFRVVAPFSTEVFDRDVYEYIKYIFEDEKV